MPSMTKYISASLVENWRQSANTDPFAFSQSLLRIIEQLTISTALKGSIRANILKIDKLRQMSASFATTAADSLINARLLLAIIEVSTQCYVVKPNFFNNTTEELLHGGHILLDDNGALLDCILAAKVLYPRYSSHYKIDKIQQYLKLDPSLTSEATEALFNKETPDYSLRAEVIFNESLFGKITKEDDKTYTWFQFEGHSHQPRSMYDSRLQRMLNYTLQYFGFSLEKLAHDLDYVSYLYHGKAKNIGQYGLSDFTETRPIVMVIKPDEEKQEQRLKMNF